jgi:hypothetical protein
VDMSKPCPGEPALRSDLDRLMVALLEEHATNDGEHKSRFFTTLYNLDSAPGDEALGLYPLAAYRWACGPAKSRPQRPHRCDSPSRLVHHPWR